jgi:hypothetical protein
MVFEGEKTEKYIFDSLKKYYLNEQPKTIVYGFHCGEIYSLYNKLKKDEDLELFVLLKENLLSKNPELQGVFRNQVSQIYLFFDYDGHASDASDVKLKAMLGLFDNETEQGKLYISYPMTEALRHLKVGVDFKDIAVVSKAEYKKVSRENCNEAFEDFKNYSLEVWHYLIDKHCKKANFIVNDKFEFPNELIGQLTILEKQKEKYIDEHNKVAVLSAFPLFLVDYYGYKKFREIIISVIE